MREYVYVVHIKKYSVPLSKDCSLCSGKTNAME
jgi:hypothetical protein